MADEKITDQEILEASRQASLDFLKGGAVQSYRVGSRSATRASLKDLLEVEDRLNPAKASRFRRVVVMDR
jgi:hypothetical protein